MMRLAVMWMAATAIAAHAWDVPASRSAGQPVSRASRAQEQATSHTPAPAPASAGSAGQPSAPTAFSSNDRLHAAREICGAVKPGSATDTLSTPQKVTGLLTANGAMLFVDLLSETWQGPGPARHVIVFGGHQVVDDGELFSGEAAQTVVYAGMLELRGGAWTIVARAPSLAETGFNGRDPAVSTRTLGAGRRALQIDETLWSGGSSMSRTTLYEPGEQGFEDLLSVATDADDCGAGEPCFRFEGTLAPAATPGDLELRLKGTYRNAAGRIVAIPDAPLGLRLTHGGYAPASRAAAALALWKAVQSPW